MSRRISPSSFKTPPWAAALYSPTIFVYFLPRKPPFSDEVLPPPGHSKGDFPFGDPFFALGGSLRRSRSSRVHRFSTALLSSGIGFVSSFSSETFLPPSGSDDRARHRGHAFFLNEVRRCLSRAFPRFCRAEQPARLVKRIPAPSSPCLPKLSFLFSPSSVAGSGPHVLWASRG